MPFVTVVIAMVLAQSPGTAPAEREVPSAATVATAATAAASVTAAAASETTAPATEFIDISVTAPTSGSDGYAERLTGEVLVRPVTGPTAATTATQPVTDATTLAATAPTEPMVIVNFSGELVERGTRKPLGDAQVVLPELGMMAFSNAEGEFEFEYVPPGTYTVIVPIVGYQKFQTTEEISPGQRTEVRYYIEPSSSNLEIIVEADRVRKEVTRITLKREEITKVPGTNNDALRVVQTLPGVSAANELRGDLLVRGSGPFDNLIQIDRMDIPFAYHFGGLKSVYSSEMLSRIDFYPGGFSSKYGRALGGVVAAETREGDSEGYHGFVDVNILLSEGLVEGPVGDNARFVIAGRRSYLDLIAAPLLKEFSPPGQFDFTVFPQFSDYQFRFDFDPWEKHTFTLYAFGADDVAKITADLELDKEPGLNGDFFIHNAFHNQAIAWSYRPTSNVDLRTMVAHYYVPQEVAIGDADNLRSEARVPVLRHDGEWDHGSGIFRFGGLVNDVTYSLKATIPQPPQRGESDFTFTDAPRITANRTTSLTNVAAYAEEILQPGDDLKLIPGVRFESLLDQSEPYVDPRFAFRYQMVSDTTIKGATGIFHAYPNPIYLDPTFGNPDLLPQRSIHYVLGVEQSFGEGWEASLEGYYKEFDDMVASYPGADRWSNEGLGYSTGFELYLRKHLTDQLFGWVTYSYSKSRRVVPPDPGHYRFRYDQPHVANVIMSYKLNRHWQAGVRWQYASGNPYTEIEERVFLVDKGFFIPIFSQALYEKRLPATHRLDVRVDRTWTFDSWQLLLYGEVWNVYMHQNILGVQYNYDYTERKFVYSFPILPTIGIRGMF